jgi:2-keto-4-pentenoate hydratase/2-oxohepta-3-ene-1,7-dioic acid hydratase in catechol pathway
MGKNFRPHRRVRSLDGDGRARTPNSIWMKPGDVCEVEIENIGVLRNVIAKGA